MPTMRLAPARRFGMRRVVAVPQPALATRQPEASCGVMVSITVFRAIARTKPEMTVFNLEQRRKMIRIVGGTHVSS